MRQVGSFGDAKNSVRPVPPEPAFPDPWMMVTSADVGATYKGQVAAYNAASQHNVDVMSAYDNASSYNTTRLPSSYGTLLADNASMSVESPRGEPVPRGGGDQPSPFGRGGDGPGTGSSGPAPRPGDEPSPVEPPPSGPGQGTAPPPGQGVPPPQQGTNPGSFVPSTPGSPGSGSPGAVPVTGGNSSTLGPIGGNPLGQGGGAASSTGPGPRTGAGGQGRGAGSGTGSGGQGRGSGTGSGSGAAGRTGAGLPHSQAGAGRGHLTPEGPRGAARGGLGGTPMGALGPARGSEDEEHERASFLQEPDPEAIFGTDERTAPPVIE